VRTARQRSAAPDPCYHDGFGQLVHRIGSPRRGDPDGRRGLVSAAANPIRWRSTGSQYRPTARRALDVFSASRYCDEARRYRLGVSARPPFGWGRVGRSATSSTTTSPRLRARPQSAARGRATCDRTGVWRFRPTCGHLLPLHEHPGALLHRLSRDIGVPATPRR